MPALTFLDLPGEIRNQIYILLLILPPPSLTDPLSTTASVHPSILQSCRQVHKEAKEVFYGSNVFMAHSKLLSGLPRLRPYYPPITTGSLISLVRRWHIRVRLDCDPFFSAEQAKAAFDDAEELIIEVLQTQFGSSDYGVLKRFEEVRGIKKARVYGSIASFPVYANWLRSLLMSAHSDLVEKYDAGELETITGRDLWVVSDHRISHPSRSAC